MPQLDRVPIQLADTGRTLAAFLHGHGGRPRRLRGYRLRRRKACGVLLQHLPVKAQIRYQFLQPPILVFQLAARFHLLQRGDHFRLTVSASRHTSAPFLMTYEPLKRSAQRVRGLRYAVALIIAGGRAAGTLASAPPPQRPSPASLIATWKNNWGTGPPGNDFEPPQLNKWKGDSLHKYRRFRYPASHPGGCLSLARS